MLSWIDDEEKAYRTSDDMVGRSIRRGTIKGLKAVGGALIGLGLGGPVGAVLGAALTNLATDAAVEVVTKVIPRSLEEKEE